MAADKYTRIRKQVSQSVNDRDLEVEIFIERLKSLLDKEVRQLERRILDGEVSAQQAAFAIQSVFASLRNGPLAARISEVEAIYVQELIRANELLEASGIPAKQIGFTQIEIDTVEALIFTQEQAISIKLQEYTNRIQSEVMKKILIGKKPNLDDLQDEVSAKVFNNLKTEIQTQTSAVHQAATVSKADKFGLRHYIYIGPDDKLTRKFCEHVLTKRGEPIYTRDEIEAMDNGQGLDVLTYAGGYNCRHHWAAITEQRAKELGFDD